MGIGPIPYSAIRAYAADYNVRGRDEFDYFYRLLQAMDVKYLSRANAANKTEDVTLIPVDDAEEQHRLFNRLAARAKHAKKKK